MLKRQSVSGRSSIMKQRINSMYPENKYSEERV